jgi:hypothetical protein
MTKINQVSAHPFNRPKGASRIRKVFRSGWFYFFTFWNCSSCARLDNLKLEAARLHRTSSFSNRVVDPCHHIGLNLEERLTRTGSWDSDAPISGDQTNGSCLSCNHLLGSSARSNPFDYSRFWYPSHGSLDKAGWTRVTRPVH